MLKINEGEKELIFLLASRLTNTYQKGDYRRDILIYNVESRIQETGVRSLEEYLALAIQDNDEFGRLISSLTIHTTQWFRELPHYPKLVAHMDAWASRKTSIPFRILSLGCSSGEEVYSLGLCCETLRQSRPSFEYKITGYDIDPTSIAKAKEALYPRAELNHIPKAYHPHVLVGEGKTAPFMTVSTDIRARCQFMVKNIADLSTEAHSWDMIVCRNVLIYFSPQQVKGMISSFLRLLKASGILCLGHSESIDPRPYGLTSAGNAIYVKTASKTPMGLLPEVMVPGAVDRTAIVLAKPAALPSVAHLKNTAALPHFTPQLILLGASTGGTEALASILREMPQPCPPILVVQHITPNFAQPFATRLAALSRLTLGSTHAGALLQPNHLYMAFHDYHIGVKEIESRLILNTSMTTPPINGHRPSVDYLFSSVATLPTKTMAILLTGMGVDGAKGLKKLKEKGALTMAQDESSSVVYGMPREAVRLGAVDFVGNLDELRAGLLKIIIGQSSLTKSA